MSLDVTGGAGGVSARLQDVRSFADVIDDVADEIRACADQIARTAVDADVVEAVVLCPFEVAAVEVAVAAATGAVIALSLHMEGTAVVLRLSVETYELVDEAVAAAHAIQDRVQGFLAGAFLASVAPVVVGTLAVGTLALAAANPLATYLAVRYAQEHPEVVEGLLLLAADGAQQLLFDNPWLLEEITQQLPWALQGATMAYPALTPLVSALTGGRWPTYDYETAVSGLVTAGNGAGLFQDSGSFTLGHADEAGAVAPTGVHDVFQQQGQLTNGSHVNDGQIQIVKVGTPPSWIVQIPGTQEWSPSRGDNPVDLTSNVQLMAGNDIVLQRMIIAAMKEADIGADEPVMLTGHSQGGIVAASLASDATFTSRFNVTDVVTAGSPIAGFDIPDDVTVLSLEHDQDVVPMLEGQENPDRPNWITVETDTPLDRMPAEAFVEEGALPGSPSTAHSTDGYAVTGGAVDASQDPSLQRWREETAHFFTGDGKPQRYQIVPAG